MVCKLTRLQNSKAEVMVNHMDNRQLPIYNLLGPGFMRRTLALKIFKQYIKRLLFDAFWGPLGSPN